MSDAFLREVKEDLEKEKALLFLKKYGMSLAVGAAVILGSTAYYSWHKEQNKTRYQAQADRFYGQSRLLLKDAKKSPDFVGVDIVYKALLTQIRTNIFSNKEDNSDVAQKLISDFSENNVFENTEHKDNFASALLHLNNLSYKSETLSLNALENEIKNYARVNGAFKDFSYEILISRAIKENNLKMAGYYYDLLQKNGYDPALERRLKVYASYLPNLKEKAEE